MEAQRHVVAGAFPDRHHAQKSLAELHDAGFTRDEIGIVTKDTCTAGILAAGVAARGILGALTGLGIPEYEAMYYECEVEAGRTVVTVRTQKNIEEATSILNHRGASTYWPTARTEPALT